MTEKTKEDRYRELAIKVTRRLNKKHKLALKRYSLIPQGTKIIMNLAKELNYRIIYDIDQAINSLAEYQTLRICRLVNEIPSHKILDIIMEEYG